MEMVLTKDYSSKKNITEHNFEIPKILYIVRFLSFLNLLINISVFTASISHNFYYFLDISSETKFTVAMVMPVPKQAMTKLDKPKKLYIHNVIAKVNIKIIWERFTILSIHFLRFPIVITKNLCKCFNGIGKFS